MPSIFNYLYRQWCKNCDNFTLHQVVYADEITHKKFDQCVFNEDAKSVSICGCGCQYTSVSILDIDKDKLQEQRVRYRAFRKRQTTQSWVKYLAPQTNPLNDLFSEVTGPETKIIESDAGLLHEEELNKQKQQEVRNEEIKELARFKNVGRNEPCLCGSNLKYKNCCLIKHQKY